MRKKQTNKEIALQSALSLFLSKGFLATSMDDIVAHSKVSKTNIYYYFKSKEDLLLAIVDQLTAHYEQRISHVLAQNDTVSAKLEKLLFILAEHTEQPELLGGCPFLTLYMQPPQEAVEARERIQAFFDRQFIAVEGMLTEGIRKQELNAGLPVRQTAALIISAIEGALFLAQASSNPDMIKTIYPALASMLQ